jgi:hypothetical protein
MQLAPKLLSVLFLCATFSLKVAAQADTTVKWKSSFIEQAGIVQGNFNRLNEILGQQGYPILGNSYSAFSIGRALHPADKDSYFAGSLMIENVFASPGKYNSTQTKAANIFSIGIKDDWCFDLVASRKWLVYPFVSFGVLYNKLKILDGINSSASFASTLSGSSPAVVEKSFSTLVFFANVGGGVERRVRFKSGIDFYFGFATGYHLTNKIRYRQRYQTNYYDSPSVRFSGWENRIIFRFEIWKRSPQTSSTRFKRFK